MLAAIFAVLTGLLDSLVSLITNFVDAVGDVLDIIFAPAPAPAP
ncbi:MULTISPECIES: hypothetical protein [Bacillus cereus group]|nr:MULTISPECIES: hypothetical protein [Bacillus cereus group]EEL51720.1 hypothetical protein bcere0022_9480 [Bacillus cereus Rock3-44]